MKPQLTEICRFSTPLDLELDGILMGSPDSRHTYIFIHGMYGSLLSFAASMSSLADDNSSLFHFNNRGASVVSSYNYKKDSEEKTDRLLCGVRHEVFSDCLDDITGAINFLKERGYKKITLVGHSTGCQKAVYYAANNPDEALDGIVLLAPISDQADEQKNSDSAALKRALEFCEKAILEHDPHRAIPKEIYEATQDFDAQRFLSAYGPNSEEDIFLYYRDGAPTTYRNVVVPVLAVFGEADDYADRPAAEIVDWFTEHSQAMSFDSWIAPAADHGLRPEREAVRQRIAAWHEQIAAIE